MEEAPGEGGLEGPRGEDDSKELPVRTRLVRAENIVALKEVAR